MKILLDLITFIFRFIFGILGFIVNIIFRTVGIAKTEFEKTQSDFKGLIPQGNPTPTIQPQAQQPVQPQAPPQQTTENALYMLDIENDTIVVRSIIPKLIKGDCLVLTNFDFGYINIEDIYPSYQEAYNISQSVSIDVVRAKRNYATGMAAKIKWETMPA